MAILPGRPLTEVLYDAPAWLRPRVEEWLGSFGKKIEDVEFYELWAQGGPFRLEVVMMDGAMLSTLLHP